MFAIPNLVSYLSDVLDVRIIGKIELYSAGSSILKNPSYDFKKSRDIQNDSSRLKYGIPAFTNDYGNGFYTCEKYEFAELWLDMYFYGSGVINVYDCNFTGLSVGVFDINKKEHMIQYMCLLLDNSSVVELNSIPKVREFISSNLDESIYNYDILIGPRLDSAYMHINEALSSLNIDLDMFIEFINMFELGEQVYIQSKEAFDAVKYKDSIIVDVSTRDDAYKESYDKFLRAREASIRLLEERGYNDEY